MRASRGEEYIREWPTQMWTTGDQIRIICDDVSSEYG
jgi:hypothetical protein